MADTNTFTVIKDERNRPALIIADDLASVAFGETIPEGTLGYDKNSGSIFRYVSGSWISDMNFSSITASDEATFTGGITVAGGAIFTDLPIEVHGSGDAGGIKWFSGAGSDATLAHAHEGVITVDLDLAGAASAASAVDFIPARTLVWRAGIEVLTTFTGGTVAHFNVGVTGGDLEAIKSESALITAGNFEAILSLGVLTTNNAASGITVSAETAGDAPATVTTGKVRVTLWITSIDGPDGSTYA